MKKGHPPSRRGAGRPTREQAELRHQELLEAALDHFLERGFEQATIEAIASSVNMTKRTVYTRYPDKSALFLAAVRSALDKQVVPDGVYETFIRDTLEETLIAVSVWRVKHVMTPLGRKLQQIVRSEAFRFPEIFNSSYGEGAMPFVNFLSDQIERHTVPDTLAHRFPVRAAQNFMGAAVLGIVRTLMLGAKMDEAEIEERITFSVKLFLEGIQATGA